ncbi:MAG: hypothetical protein J6J13_04700 [Clostridia bacterium]|nr:hypothetical protein [Clostridia bacterium]
MKNRWICLALAIAMILAMFSGCRKPSNSANGDTLTPEGVKITVNE